MKKIVKIALVLMMSIITMISIITLVYANASSSPPILYAAYEYSGTPPTHVYTPDELGIVRIEEHGNWLEIGVEKEPFPLQEVKPVFLYKDKLYQILRGIVHAAYECSETPPTHVYTPDELGIVRIEEYGNWLEIVVKESFPLPEEMPIFVYKDKLYRISELWVTPGLDKNVKQWQTHIVGINIVGWIVIGVLFLNGTKKKE